MLQALRRLAVALAIASGLSITAMALAAPGAYAAALVHLADDDDDRPKGGVDTGLGGVSRDDDDDRPKGGVDTGSGGAEVRLSAAAGGGLPVVPLALAGGGVLLAGAYGVSRKLGRR